MSEEHDVDYEKYLEIYGADEHERGPHGHINLDQTEICIDLECACGYQGHLDGIFIAYRCPMCSQHYAVGHVLNLIPITDEQSKLFPHISMDDPNDMGEDGGEDEPLDCGHSPSDN